MSKARCTKCGDVIESKSVHDWRECKCGSIFIDGGNEYFRCGFKELSNIEVWNEETKTFEPMKTVVVATNDDTNVRSRKNTVRNYGKNKICTKLPKTTLKRRKNDN